jgi:hypothetical protein
MAAMASIEAISIMKYNGNIERKENKKWRNENGNNQSIIMK